MERSISRRDFLKIAGGGTFGAFLLASCGFGVGEGRNESNGQRVTVWDISTGEQRELLEELVSKFNEEHPDSPVTVQFFENDPYKQRLQVSMGAGDPPDIFYGWGGGVLKNYVDAGRVYDITDELDASMFFPQVMEGVTFDGRVYGIPKAGMQPVVFYYNRKIFDDYGLSVPETWSEIREIIEELRNTEIAPISLAGQNRWPYLMYIAYLVNRLAGPEPFQRVLANEPEAWSHTAFIEANTMIQDLVSIGAFPEGFTSLNFNTGQSTSLLYTDRAAMQLMGSWDYENILSNAPEFIEEGKLGWFSFPEVEGGSGDPDIVTGNLTNFYSISEASENKEGALTFLEEAIKSDFYIQGLIDLGLVPPVEGIEVQLEASERADWLTYIYNIARNAPYFDLSWDQALPPEPAQALLTNLDQIFLGEITPEQFSENMNATIGQ